VVSIEEFPGETKAN